MLHVIMGVLVLCVLATGSLAQPLEHQSQQEVTIADARARQARIQAELAGIKRTLAAGEALAPADAWAATWAGEYSCGDGLGMNVRMCVSPRAGVSYIWTGCLGTYDADHGDIVKVLDDGLELSLKSPAGSRFRYMSERLYFVRWGERRYLIPEAQMRDVQKQYAERPDDPFYLFDAAVHVDDREKPVSGVLELPPKYAVDVEKLEASVVSIDEIKRDDQWEVGVEYVTINLTLSDDVREHIFFGLDFTWIDPEDPTRRCTISASEPDGGPVRAWISQRVATGAEVVAPDVGDVVTTYVARK